jgi:uncharacterized YigZ family protein
MNSYKTVKTLGESRFEDRKSVFLGYAMPVSTENDAIGFINSIKKEYPDARHWVYAYVLRENSTMRFTDDREPQGTAGIPILDIIRKNELTDIVVVVVRYFGGVLLGTGGLVHAYSESAIEAIGNAVIIEYNTYTDMSITVNYSDYQKITPIFSDFDFKANDTEYMENVKITGSVISERYEEFLKKLTETTGGRCNCIFLENKYDFRE